MTPSRAKEVLEGMGLVDFSSDFLRGHSHNYLLADRKDAQINGIFTAEELQAIALWMQDPESVVNAESAEGWKQVTNYIKTGASK